MRKLISASNPPSAGPLGSVAVNLDDNGAVIGHYNDASGAVHGYLRNSDGTFTTIDDPSAFSGSNSGTLPQGINASGVIVGYYDDSANSTHGFVRK